MSKTLGTLRNYLFVFLVVGAPLSFAPSIATPLLNFPSFRIGLYQIVATLFILTTITPLIKNFSKLLNANKFAIYSVLTLLIAAIITVPFDVNRSRGVLLTSSVVFLLILLLCSWWYIQIKLTHLPKRFVYAFLLSAVVLAVLGVAQLSWGTFADSGALLCKGCTGTIFGYPRINLTTAEPLFLASSLLPLLLVAFYLRLTKYRFATVSLFASTFTIGLSFARSGYLAALIGVLIISTLTYFYHKTSLLRILSGLGIMFLAGVLSLIFLLGSATIRFHNTTPDITYIVLQSTVEHLSLDVIKLPDVHTVSSTDSLDDPADDFHPPGLIGASTNERLDSAELAVSAWRVNTKNILLGTGLGNLGPYVVDNINSSAPSNLTVYIFYILLLAELGIVGLASFLVLFISAIIKLCRYLPNQPLAILGIGLLISFLVQYFFFGSYINVVYIWLWLGLILGSMSRKKMLLNIKLDRNSAN